MPILWLRKEQMSDFKGTALIIDASPKAKPCVVSKAT